MRKNILRSNSGYSLIELVVVIIIIGILASVAMRSLRSGSDAARTAETRQELRQLTRAIAGDPELVNSGFRTDYGYVGDVGSLPPDLDALVTRPGGFATWNGPYVRDDFYASAAAAASEFKIDAWGKAYSYSGGNLITSSGGGNSISQQVAGSVEQLLYNRVDVVVTDPDRVPPGANFRDSIAVSLTYPDGSGSMVTVSKSPSADGWLSFDSIPAGRHSLEVVFLPTVDTVTRYVNVDPGAGVYSEISLWNSLTAGGSATGGEVTKVAGSDSVTGSWCNNLTFWVENNDSEAAILTDITLTWSAPTAYYRTVVIDGQTVFTASTPWPGSGATANFTVPITVDPGAQARVQINSFHAHTNGGPRVNIANTTFTVLFSGGSTFDATVGGCP